MLIETWVKLNAKSLLPQDPRSTRPSRHSLRYIAQTRSTIISVIRELSAIQRMGKAEKG